MSAAEQSPGKNRNTQTYLFLLTACLTALLINTVASWFFYSRWEEVEEQFSKLVKQQTETSLQLDQTESELRMVYPELLILRDPDYSIITLKSAENSPKASSRIYWNSYTRKTYLDPLSMGEPDSGKYYRVWGKVNQQWMAVGDIQSELDDDQLIYLGNVASASQWLISEESVGDSTITTPRKILQSGQ